jgi:phage recombination protein Bet
MSTALSAPAKSGVPSLALSEGELINVLENSLYPGASSESIKLVIGYCRASGLDPMQKPAHIVPIWDGKAGRMRDVIMPGIGLYRTQAARSGQYAGVSEPEFGPDENRKIGGTEITFPAWCRVTVKRSLPNGQLAEFSATERWMENYAVKGGKEKSIAPNAMWYRRPYAQLAKCAEAQALRKAFPEVGAAPTADEMEGKGEEIDITPSYAPAAPALPERQPYAESAMDTNLPKWQSLVESGKKTPEQIIAMVGSKAALSDEQKARIVALARKQESEKQQDAPAPVAETVDVETGEVITKVERDEFVRALNGADRNLGGDDLPF